VVSRLSELSSLLVLRTNLQRYDVATQNSTDGSLLYSNSILNVEPFVPENSCIPNTSFQTETGMQRPMFREQT
jgi:hypothetical protein